MPLRIRLYRKPVLLNYYLTYRCNAACSFCDIWQKPSPYVEEDDVEVNLTDARRLGVKIVDFTGGEPLLHRKLPTFLAIAKEKNLLTTITTNTLLYPKYARALQGKVDMLHFSLDSAFAEKHNANRGVNCFSHFEKSLDIALGLGEKPDILFTVTTQNWQEIPLVYEKYIKPLRLILILNPIFSYGDVGTNALPPQAYEFLRCWQRKPYVYLNNAFLKLRQNGGNDIFHTYCRASSATIVISPYNELLLPCYHAHEQGYRFPIQKNLYQLWHAPEVVHLRKLEGRWNFCKGCSVNCYFEPSFGVEWSIYFRAALPSKVKYGWYKWRWKAFSYLVR
ncbi:MAG: radical SAM protein [Bacteroidia bacterium]